jgi:hypothetical protein
MRTHPLHIHGHLAAAIATGRTHLIACAASHCAANALPAFDCALVQIPLASSQGHYWQ